MTQELNRGRRAMCRLRLAASLLVPTTACAQLESAGDKPFSGKTMSSMGPRSKPPTVDCKETDALDDLRDDHDFDRVWSCEIVLGTGRGGPLPALPAARRPAQAMAR